MQTALHTFLRLVEQEVTRACRKHPPLHSLHEAYAVLLEEVDEFKEQVWQQTAARDRQAVLLELVQIAAMAMRTARDCGLLGEEETPNGRHHD
jgi:hypothetical protein